MERDVVIVGAGPAGASAAMALKQKGYDVLLMDRHEFPRDKSCGDGIPAGAIEHLYPYGMEEKIKSAGFYPITALRIVSPSGHIFHGDLAKGSKGGDSYVIPRTKFDNLLQSHAVEMGAEFCQAQVKEPIVENGQVKGVRAKINGKLQNIKAKIVIGADGVTSVIARAIRPDKQQNLHRAVALRAYIDDIEEVPNCVEFHLYKGILPGYAWIFPNGKNSANIGLGMRLDKFRRLNGDLKEMMKVFLGIPAVKDRVKNGGQLRDFSAWQLNFGSQRNIQRAYDGAVLIGDAAGFINPLTGGGIHNALISAQLAAESIHEAITTGDLTRRILQKYEKRAHDEMWSSLRRSYFIQRWLLYFPFMVDILVKRAHRDGQFAQTFMTKL